MIHSKPLWIPDEATTARSNIHAAMQSQSFSSYQELYRWSIDQRAEFWEHVVRTLGIRFEQPARCMVDLGNDPTSPTWLPDARWNIAESCFQTYPDSPAIVYGKCEGSLQTLSYGDVHGLANAVASGLRRLGLQPGDAVAIFMPMTALSVSVYLGIILAGCVVVSIADSFSAEQVRTRLQIGQAKAIFTVACFQRGNKRLPLHERVVAAEGPRAILVEAPTLKDVEPRTDDLSWYEFLGDPAWNEVCYGTSQTPINLLFSSGTTGEPKAVPWDHTTPIKAASDAHFHHDLHPGDVVAWPTNLGWMMGPWLIFSTMINGGTIALFEGSPLDKAFGQFIQDARVNMLGIIPSMVSHWRRSGCMTDFDWSAIRVFSSTGECSNPDDMQYLSQLADGKPVIEYCGGTELGGGYITSTVVQPNFPSTFSTPALGSDLVLLDEENQASDRGEVFLVPPGIGLSQRLVNRDHQAVYHQDVPVGPQGETLRRHGDLMLAIGNGYFRALGRADDTMNLGGIKISAAEIERVLLGVGGVEEVAAIASTPPDGGPDRLILCVGADPSALPNAAELQAAMQQAIKEKLNPLFKIQDLYLLDRLPRTASNKIMRRQLRESYEEHAG